MGNPAPVLALFDMDRTLVRVNTAGLYFRARVRAGQISKRDALRIAGIHLGYQLSVVDMPALIALAVQAARGMAEAEMIAFCQALYSQQVQGQICPHARQTLENHRQQGHVLALVTASTPYLAAPLAQALGIAHVLCTEMAVQDGVFTGELLRPPCFGLAKVQRAEELAAEHETTLSNAWFYTDSYSDAPLLQVVGHPQVVRPDPRLRWLAWRQNWPVLQWQ